MDCEMLGSWRRLVGGREQGALLEISAVEPSWFLVQANDAKHQAGGTIIRGDRIDGQNRVALGP